jgi:tRNA (guanosine-2'-O-)-methyltransferase
LSPRRPPRAWVGAKVAADPSELLGPRGLTQELLTEAEPDPEPLEQDAQFFWSMMSPERQQRIERVVESRLQSVTVVLDRLIDAHNTAAILRTAEALGVCAVQIVPHEKDDGTAHRRVTQDADKWLDVTRCQSGIEAIQSLRNYEVWAGHLDANARTLSELPADRPIALLFGNEHEGPGAETLKACAGTFRIPMAGFSQSFNVSVAAGIALQSVCERRRAFLGKPGDLDDLQKAQLKARFTLLAAKLARRLKPQHR